MANSFQLFEELTDPAFRVADSLDPGGRRPAAQFCFWAIQAYWRAVVGAGSAFPAFPSPPDGTIDESLYADVRAAQIGRSASSVPEPAAAFALSSLYASMLPPAVRSTFGVFFTPPALVERLLMLATEAGFDWNIGRILDPACGGGAFLAPAAALIATECRRQGRSAREILDVIASRIAGVELDPFAGWMSHVFLLVAIRDVIAEARQEVPRLVKTSDALSAGAVNDPGAYDLVVGNPPYGRVTLTGASRARFAASLYGHANLYGLFTHLALDLVKPGGLVAYVTPTSFLGGQYFKNLRRLLTRCAPPASIAFVADRMGVFDDVLQETLLVVFRKDPATGSGRRRKVAVQTIRPTGDGQFCEVTPIGAFPNMGEPGAPWVFPRDPSHVRLFSRMPEWRHRLLDYGYTVSTGPLVWNRHKRQLRGDAGTGRYPLIWAESVGSGGSFRFSADRRNHLPYFQLGDGQDHLLLRRECVLVQRTTAKEQSRRLIAAVLPQAFIDENDGVVVENHLNVISCANGHAAVPLAVLMALLNSEVADQLFRCISGSVAVSAYELENIPLPDPRAACQLVRILPSGTGASGTQLQIPPSSRPL